MKPCGLFLFCHFSFGKRKMAYLAFFAAKENGHPVFYKIKRLFSIKNGRAKRQFVGVFDVAAGGEAAG